MFSYPCGRPKRAEQVETQFCIHFRRIEVRREPCRRDHFEPQNLETRRDRQGIERATPLVVAIGQHEAKLGPLPVDVLLRLTGK